MFYKNITAAYKILEITSDATDNEVKKAYRKMAAKFHPDKVHHLGEEFQKMAEEKFKFVNDADADYIIMTNRTVFGNKNNQITNCFDKFKGIDVFKVERNGLLLSTIRKIKM